MHAAHMELDNLKAHARDQDAVIADMQEELRKNQSVLGAISKCARKWIGWMRVMISCIISVKAAHTCVFGSFFISVNTLHYCFDMHDFQYVC